MAFDGFCLSNNSYPNREGVIPHCGFNFYSPGVWCGVDVFSCVLSLFVCPPLKDIPRYALIFASESFLFTAKLLEI